MPTWVRKHISGVPNCCMFSDAPVFALCDVQTQRDVPYPKSGLIPLWSLTPPLHAGKRRQVYACLREVKEAKRVELRKSRNGAGSQQAPLKRLQRPGDLNYYGFNGNARQELSRSSHEVKRPCTMKQHSGKMPTHPPFACTEIFRLVRAKFPCPPCGKCWSARAVPTLTTLSPREIWVLLGPPKRIHL